MSSEKTAAYPLCAWLVSAMTAPLAFTAAGQGYLGLIPVLAGCGWLCGCVFVLSGHETCESKWYCLMELLWLAAALAVAAHWGRLCWQTENNTALPPLVLLGIAVCAAWNGGRRASRVGGVVFWLLALLYAVVLAAGAEALDAGWLTPTWDLCSPMAVFALLIPAVITFLPREKGNCYAPTLLVIGILGLLFAVWTAGALSAAVCQSLPFPFYEYSKSISLFGVAKRLESLTSVALTMGVYCLMSLLLSAAGHLAERFRAGWGRTGILLCAGAGAGLMGFMPGAPAAVLGGGALFFWGILPLLAGSLGKKKKAPKK